MIGPDGIYEGSTEASTFFICGEDGEYGPQIGNGSIFTECIPRAKRCVCLGDDAFKEEATLATKALDMYCRNKTYEVGMTNDADMEGNPLNISIPTKVIQQKKKVILFFTSAGGGVGAQVRSIFPYISPA
jgi:hypothetical protein